MIKYFHELTVEEFQVLVKARLTWEQVAIDYPQPTWCRYPQAVQGPWGCNSLMAHLVTNETFCNSCDCSRNYVEPVEIPDPENVPVWD